jgi:hypothetical protein
MVDYAAAVTLAIYSLSGIRWTAKAFCTGTMSMGSPSAWPRQGLRFGAIGPEHAGQVVTELRRITMEDQISQE